MTLLFLQIISVLNFSSLHAVPQSSPTEVEFDSALYTLVDVVCVGEGKVGREYMAIQGSGKPEQNAIQFSEAGTFSVSGLRLGMEHLTEIGNSEAETQLFANKKASIKKEYPVTLDGCEPGKSMFRIVSKDTNYTLARFLEILPFQARCVQLPFNNCVDQRQRMGKALEEAESQDKYLIVVYGRTGCPWSSAMLTYLSESTSLNTKAVVRSISVSSQNRTGHVVGNSLTSVSDPTLAGEGLPLLFLMNPKNSKVAAINPVDLEKGESYHFSKVDSAIRSKLESIK